MNSDELRAFVSTRRYEMSLSTWQGIDHPNRLAPNGFEAGDPVK